MKTFRGMRSTAWIVMGLILVSMTASAQQAGPVALAHAQRLYEEAVSLMEAKSYATACPKLEKVTELVPMGIGGHETLADCYEALGRRGSAWEQYTIAKSLSLKAGEPARAAENADKAKALEPTVAKITIVVDKQLGELGGLTILRDGEVQDPALWNTPLPVDTGRHKIEAKASGRESWSKEVMVLADGVSLSVEVPLKRLQLLPIATLTPGAPDTDPSASRAWQRPLGYTTIGLGVASLMTSAILSGMAVEKRDASVADAHCNGSNICDPVGLALREQAMDYANGATGTVIVGGLLAAGGLALVLTAPKKKAQGEEKQVGVWWTLSVSPSGVGLQATF